MCAACTDSAVTGRDACIGHLVRLCAACTYSAMTGRDAFTGRLVRMCACLSALGCCVSLRDAWLSLYKLYVSPKAHLYRSHASSAKRVRFCSALAVYPKELAVTPWDAIRTERTPAPSIIGNHDARVLGTTITALATHLLTCSNTSPTKDGCGKQ